MNGFVSGLTSVFAGGAGGAFGASGSGETSATSGQGGNTGGIVFGSTGGDNKTLIIVAVVALVAGFVAGKL